MKRSLIYLMVGVISFGAFGGGTYGLLKMNEPPVQETPPVDDDDDGDDDDGDPPMTTVKLHST